MALDVKSLEGNEIADDYVREAQTRGRWGETWDAFKGNFGKIVLINVFMLISILPDAAILFIRSIYIAGLGMTYPFNANTGLGYPAYTDTVGLTEKIYLSQDLMFYGLLIVGGFIASIGLAGGAYSIKKLLNTHGKFSLKSFFHGVRVGYFNTVLPVTIFLVFYFACVIIGDWKDLVIAQGGSGAGPITAYVFIIIATVLVGIYCAWLFAVGVSYRLPVTKLFKNAFSLLVGSPIPTLFFAAFALIPVWLVLLGSLTMFIKVIAYILLILFGLSFIMLVWLSFTQGVFDLYIAPNYKKGESEANNKKSAKELTLQQDDSARVARELLAAGRSELIGKPIMPISDDAAVPPLGKTYTRADISQLAVNKNKLGEEIAAYEKAHKDEPVYAEYNKLFADREKALQSEGKKGKKKKVSVDNLLK